MLIAIINVYSGNETLTVWLPGVSDARNSSVPVFYFNFVVRSGFFSDPEGLRLEYLLPGVSDSDTWS